MNEQFWKQLQERITFGVVEGVRQSGAAMTATHLQRFLSSAPVSLKQLGEEDWKSRFHHKAMLAANARPKTEIERYDFEVICDLWQNEFPNLDEKPRSSGTAAVMNTLSIFNTGLVRVMCATDTTITPAALDEGVSILINFPFSNHGPTGRFIAGDWKYRVQKHILRRKWTPGDYWNVMILDEYQQSATGFDPQYLAMCRSHGASMLCLTQTIHSEYAAIGGQAGTHRADQLLSNFGTHIYHLCDPHTARYASDLLGYYREAFVNVSPRPAPDIGEEIFGNGSCGMSLSESYQPVLQPRVFMTGLRTGGPSNHYRVDGIVIRTGEPFRNGCNYQYVTFSQK
jgi:hypothetical protein